MKTPFHLIDAVALPGRTILKSTRFVALAGILLSGHWANAQQIPTFTKITQGALVTDRLDSHLPAWGDFDNDGRLDVLVGGPVNQWQLYRNESGALFSSVTSGAMSQHSFHGAIGVWGDPDNDGNLDFYAGPTWSLTESPAMYWGDGHGDFVRQPLWASSHIPVTGLIGAWGDFDRDGFQDAFLQSGAYLNAGMRTNSLLHNNGDRTFAVTANSALDVWNDSVMVYTVDCDDDGDLDLVLARLGTGRPTQFYRNDGHGFFTEATPEPLHSEVGRVGSAAWADFDNDGDLDVIFGGSAWWGTSTSERFYINTGGGTFTPWTGQPDRFEYDLPSGWAAVEYWVDFDNDGYLDLYSGADQFRLWRNLGDGTFEEVFVEGPTTQSSATWWWASWVDFNNDGFLDLFVANRGGNPNYLYENDGNPNQWLEVKLRGMVSDRMAVGAKIFATATIRGRVMRQLRVISATDSDQTLVAHFGLGDATNVDLLRIEWPIGVVQELTNVVANQILTVTEHQAGATNAPTLTVSKSADSALQLRATGDTNLRYAFEASTNLVQWTKIAVRTNLTGTVDYTPATSSSPQRFYRVQVP